MSEQMSIIVIICAMATVMSVLNVLMVQLWHLLGLRALYLAWEQEQLRDQQFWEVQQEKRMCELKTRLTIQMQQLQEIWHHWESEDAALVTTHVQQYEQQIARMNLEYEVLRLPRTEDVPLA